MGQTPTVSASQPRNGDALDSYGIRGIRTAFWNLGAPQLAEHVLARREGTLAGNGALVVRTGQFTGRSPKDKFVVRDGITERSIDWGAVNQPMTPAHFDRLHSRVLDYWRGHEVYVQDVIAGADPQYALRVRVITQLAWHSLFARQLFIRPSRQELTAYEPDFTIMFAPDLRVKPEEAGANSETCIAISFSKRLVLISGTSYAGEMKKSAFTIMNYLLPGRDVFPMHCSANVGQSGDVALFFGLSGTGKTTLSADSSRGLIGDDEHGWSEEGVFNFEGGCYAKCIHLSRSHEPHIWNAIRFGTVLENVVMDEESRVLDFDSNAITENTRAAYPIDFIENAVAPSVGGHPSNVVFLTADAFGVLPPISSLTPEQAMYHFLSGYTAKVAGTERGLSKEPQATFSACFGAPFLPRPAAVYADLLGEKLRRHNARCWLVNTGWVGGPYGVGERMKLPYTRAMLSAAIRGDLNHVPAVPHPVFHVMVPQSCPDVPAGFLDARGMWADKEAYDRAAHDLSGRFQRNFEKFSGISSRIAESAPR